MFAPEWGIRSWLRLQQESAPLDLPEANGTTSAMTGLTISNDDFRKAIISEFSFKAISELYAAKVLLQLAAIAPSNDQFEYLITHIVDEVKHANMFRQHLIDIGYATNEDIDQKLIDENQDSITQVIEPLKQYFEKYVVEQRDFICGIAIITIVLEGILAPSAELGEIKWRHFDPLASKAQGIGNQDEVRHLAVCSGTVKEAVLQDASAKNRVLACVEEGMALWKSTPIQAVILQREKWFQMGMAANLDLIKGYALTPGLLLSESTPESRLALSQEWNSTLSKARMVYMGLY